MEKKMRWIWIVAGALLIALIVLLIIPKKEEQPFNHYDFSETVLVTNGTDYERLDTLVLVLAEKVFGYDSIDVKVFHLPEVITETTEFLGIVQKLPFGPHKYLILLRKGLSLYELKEVLSHEFIHIEQYESGDLEIHGKTYIWKGSVGSFEGVPYNERPFEIRAYSKQHPVIRKLNTFLYD